MECLLNFVNEAALEKIIEDDRSDDQVDGLLDEIKMTKFSELAYDYDEEDEKIDLSKKYERRRNLSTGAEFLK